MKNANTGEKDKIRKDFNHQKKQDMHKREIIKVKITDENRIFYFFVIQIGRNPDKFKTEEKVPYFG